MSVLLVMSDDVDARLASYLLAQVVPTVVTAGTLAEARTALADCSWSAVILDTVLPDGTGFELLHTLSEMSFEGGILVLSSSRDVADKVRALDAGADDYVVRPYEPAELLARVRVILRRARRRMGSAEGGVIRVGGLELDVNALSVTLPGNRRERLTPNEMRLLHYLMTHAQRVVDHQELLARLFGTANHQASSNAVGVYMRRVRRKIEANPDQPRYIVTVRGSGYRFQGGDTRPAQPSPVPSPKDLSPKDEAAKDNGNGPTARQGGLTDHYTHPD
jgi:DNA-binding response OmpR family regulator